MLASVVMIRRPTRRPTLKSPSLLPAPAPIKVPDPIGNQSACLSVTLSVIFRHDYRLSSIFRIYFQVPYPVTPLFATLRKTAGVCANNSHSGTARRRAMPSTTFIRSGLRTFRHAQSYPLFFSDSCTLFCTFLHFLALAKCSILFFSSDSALFAKNHLRWGEGHSVD